MNFITLHQQTSPILIANVWDVASAKVAQGLDFEAIGTSSGAIATMLGYQDGEEISFEVLEYIVGRITKSIEIPLSVDLEAGYSRNAQKVADNIIALANLGVVGINIEDSIVAENRKIVDVDTFSDLLKKVTNILSQRNIDMFVNVRTDTFILDVPNRIDETISRANRYKECAADGLFVPCIQLKEDILYVNDNIELPLNVMCMPGLPDFNELAELGVHRISMGNFVYNKMIEGMESQMASILQTNSFKTLFN